MIIMLSKSPRQLSNHRPDWGSSPIWTRLARGVDQTRWTWISEHSLDDWWLSLFSSFHPHLDQSSFADPGRSEDDNLCIINLDLDISGFFSRQPLHNWCVPSPPRDCALATSRASPLWMLLSCYDEDDPDDVIVILDPGSELRTDKQFWKRTSELVISHLEHQN